MKKIAAIIAFSALALSLSGCALLYPNWGTTQNPGTSQSVEPSTSASAAAVRLPLTAAAANDSICLSLSMPAIVLGRQRKASGFRIDLCV